MSKFFTLKIATFAGVCGMALLAALLAYTVHRTNQTSVPTHQPSLAAELTDCPADSTAPAPTSLSVAVSGAGPYAITGTWHPIDAASLTLDHYRYAFTHGTVARADDPANGQVIITWFNPTVSPGNNSGSLTATAEEMHLQPGDNQINAYVRAIYETGDGTLCRSDYDFSSTTLAYSPPTPSCIIDDLTNFKVDPAESSRNSCPSSGGTEIKIGYNRVSEDFSPSHPSGVKYEYKLYGQKTHGGTYDLLGTQSFTSSGDRDQSVFYYDADDSLCGESSNYYVRVQKECADGTSQVYQSDTLGKFTSCCSASTAPNDPAAYCENVLGGQCGVVANPSSPGNCPPDLLIADDPNLWRNHFCKSDLYDRGACCVPNAKITPPIPSAK